MLWNIREFYPFPEVGLTAPATKLILNYSPVDVLYIQNNPKF